MSESQSGSQEAKMAAVTALKAAKKELRILMKQKLKGIAPNSVNFQSAAVFKTITASPSYQNAQRIGIYLSMPGGEIQTEAIVRHALGNGKQVFVPFLHKSLTPSPDTPRSVMDMVDLRSLEDYEGLKRDSWGIPTIDVATVKEREHILATQTGESGKLDMILIPGVAFELHDGNGFVKRLGHGKGFYDLFLHRYLEGRGTTVKELSLGLGTDALLYGLALEEQLLRTETELSVPVGENDHLLHGLLVGSGTLVEGNTKAT